MGMGIGGISLASCCPVAELQRAGLAMPEPLGAPAFSRRTRRRIDLIGLFQHPAAGASLARHTQQYA